MSNRISRPVATKKDTKEEVKEWILKQSNFSDAVIYLIEKEIYTHGIKDLSASIPKTRNENYFKNTNKNNHGFIKNIFQKKSRKTK
jgi:hypothetical protein